MPSPITFKSAVTSYKHRASVLLRSNGLKIKAPKYHISGWHTSSAFKFDLNPASDLKLEATAFFALPVCEKPQPANQIQINRYLIGQVNNRLQRLRAHLNFLISGIDPFSQEKTFSWPKDQDPRVKLLCEELAIMEWASEMFYDNLTIGYTSTHLDLSDLAKRSSPHTLIEIINSLFIRLIVPEIFEDIIATNIRYDLSDQIPGTVNKILGKSLRVVEITNGLARGAFAWTRDPTAPSAISPQVIKRFSEMRDS